MDDISKNLANSSTNSSINNWVDAFDGEIDDGQFMFSIVSDKSTSSAWLPDKVTVCKMEVVAIENKDNFTRAPLQTKTGKPFVNLRIKATDVNNGNNFRIIYEKLYSNNKETAYIITKALGVDVPDFTKFAAITLLNSVGYAEVNSQPYPANDGTTKRKAVISKWLLDFDASALPVEQLPVEQEELPF